MHPARIQIGASLSKACAMVCADPVMVAGLEDKLVDNSVQLFSSKDVFKDNMEAVHVHS